MMREGQRNVKMSTLKIKNYSDCKKKKKIRTLSCDALRPESFHRFLLIYTTELHEYNAQNIHTCQSLKWSKKKNKNRNLSFSKSNTHTEKKKSWLAILTFVLDSVEFLFGFVNNGAQIEHITVVKVPLIICVIFEYIKTFLDSSLNAAQPKNGQRLMV